MKLIALTIVAAFLVTALSLAGVGPSNLSDRIAHAVAVAKG
jgi:hypothetical protein